MPPPAEGVLPCCTVTPEIVTVAAVLIKNTAVGLFPSTANQPAPRPLLIRFLSTVSRVLLVGVIVPVRPNVIVSRGAAAAIAARSVQFEASGHVPPLSPVEVTVMVAAWAGRGIASSGRLIRLARMSVITKRRLRRRSM